MSEGIKETKEVLRFVLSFIKALKLTYEDGDFDWYDAKNFIDLFNIHRWSKTHNIFSFYSIKELLRLRSKSSE